MVVPEWLRQSVLRKLKTVVDEGRCLEGNLAFIICRQRGEAYPGG
jgi:hypothetical protein